jgi:2-aminoadipate transaminase
MNNSKSSLYQTIARALEERILAGLYRPGGKIPTIRQVAVEFGCNKLTVQKSFDQLCRKGLIEKVVGSGSYVKYPQKVSTPAGRYDFKSDYLSATLFPFEQVRTIFDSLFDSEGPEALAPPPVTGDSGLVTVLSSCYQVPADRMVIISGAQQGLDLVAKVFAARLSDSMLFEDPTYPGAISLFKARHFVSLENDGPDMDEMDRKLSDGIRLFYAMPSVHNPTGITYGVEKRDAVAQRARRHPFYIVEDDYLGDLHAQRKPRFIDICPDRTIYIKSLSQTTMAGIRLGFMVLPEDLKEKFVYAKFSSDIASFGLLQKFMREFIKCGGYQSHLDTVTTVAEQRRNRLTALLTEFPGLTAKNEQSGCSLWVKSRHPLTAPHVPWSRGEEFSFSREFRAYFRLSFMNMEKTAFEQGVGFLDGLWRQFGADTP